MLLKAQQTQLIRSISGVSLPFLVIRKWIGKVLCNIGNLCHTEPMTRSMCMRTLAIVRVCSISTADN